MLHFLLLKSGKYTSRTSFSGWYGSLYNSRLQYFQTFVLALLCTSMPNQGAILHVKHPVHMYDKPLAIRHTSWLLGGKAAYAHCLFLCNLSRYQRQVVLRRDRKSDSGLRCREAMLRTRTSTTKTETDKHTLIIFDSVHSSIPRRARWAWVATSCSASNNFRAFNAWAPSAKEHGTTFGLDIIPFWCDIYKYIRIIYIYIYRCIYIVHMPKYHEQDAHRGLINQREAQYHFQF